MGFKIFFGKGLEIFKKCSLFFISRGLTFQNASAESSQGIFPLVYFLSDLDPEVKVQIEALGRDLTLELKLVVNLERNFPIHPQTGVAILIELKVK